jgi:hypothetical protein
MITIFWAWRAKNFNYFGGVRARNMMFNFRAWSSKGMEFDP